MTLVPMDTLSISGNELYLLDQGSRRLVVKHYIGEHAESRRREERDALSHWYEHGYLVPKLAEIDDPEIPVPSNVFEYLDGESLRQRLLDPVLVDAVKLKLVEALFESNLERHAEALSKNDPRLVQHDPNTGNVLIVDDSFYHIDLEKPARDKPVPDLVAIELAKLLRWIVRDIGIQTLNAVTELLVRIYAGHGDVLRQLVTRTRGRKFQFIHRMRDSWRKKHMPGDVTKYDIADAVARAVDSQS